MNTNSNINTTPHMQAIHDDPPRPDLPPTQNPIAPPSNTINPPSEDNTAKQTTPMDTPGTAASPHGTATSPQPHAGSRPASGGAGGGMEHTPIEHTPSPAKGGMAPAGGSGGGGGVSGSMQGFLQQVHFGGVCGWLCHASMPFPNSPHLYIPLHHAVAIIHKSCYTHMKS